MDSSLRSEIDAPEGNGNERDHDRLDVIRLRYLLVNTIYPRTLYQINAVGELKGQERSGQDPL